MHITDIITAPWAILPDKLREIQAFYSAHARGEKIDIAAIEARIGKPLVSADQGYQNVGGVAVIPVSGVIGKKMNMMTQISGGASTQLIERDIKAALSDSEVNSILLHIDSPGGTVDGTQTLNNVVRAARAYKPVVSFADGVMASAVYWFGSAADEIVAAEKVTQIGSIGVVTSHTDTSKAQEQAGIKKTDIVAGKFKRIASQNSPLSDEALAYKQAEVDQIYAMFVSDVAENLGVSVDTVLVDMADGRIFLAEEAQKRGMIDHIATIETTILNMQTGVWPIAPKKAEEAQAEPVAQIQEVIKLDITAIKEQYPAIVAELQKEGAELERARIADCESVALAGHEAIVSAMKLDGKSTGADVARAIITAEKSLQATRAAAFIDNAPAVIAAAPVTGFEISAEDDKNLPIEQRAQAKWDNTPSIRNEYASFKGYLAVMKKQESGKVRISGTQH